MSNKWNEFVMVLLRDGIKLRDKEDSLVWDKNNKDGIIIAKNTYEIMS